MMSEVFIIMLIIGAALSLYIFYVLIKAAVRNGILEAHHRINAPEPKPQEDKIAQIICQFCMKKYDMDYPKCPYCKSKM